MIEQLDQQGPAAPAPPNDPTAHAIAVPTHRKIRRPADRLRGTGPIYRDGVALGETDYDITIFQDFVVLDDRQELAVTTDWIVQLPTHTLDRLALWRQAAMLTLVIGDGRRLRGFLNGSRLVLSGKVEQPG